MRARRVAVAGLMAVLVAGCVSGENVTAPSTTGATGGSASGGTVTVYTGRHYGIEKVFEQFTATSGIAVRFTTGTDPQLRERLVAEKANTPADVLMTADAGNAALAAAAGALRSLDSAALSGAVPTGLRDPQNRWIALSERARTVVYSATRVTTPPTTYAGVGEPQWKNKVCLRPSTHPYTQSLVSSIIAADGEAAAETVVRSWVANNPIYIDSDTDIYNAIVKGDCDVAIANTYYLGRLQTKDPAYPVRISWPEQGPGQRGVHVNVSAAGVTTYAPNPAGAQRLLEWLATDGQQAFSDANFEYPVRAGVAPAPVVASWGTFRADRANVVRFGELQPSAVRLIDRAGYR